MKKLNKTIGAVALALLALLAITFTASAQPIQLKSITLTNFNIGTLYYPLGGSNVSQGEGTYFYTGGTNTVTLTNAQTIYAPSTAASFSLAALQNVPVWWSLAVTCGNAGTSNTVVGLDLSPDGVYWTSNTVTATIASAGTATNVANIYFPLNNGTNVFSGYSRGRWSYASTAQTNNVTLLQNRLQAVR